MVDGIQKKARKKNKLAERQNKADQGAMKARSEAYSLYRTLQRRAEEQRRYAKLWRYADFFLHQQHLIQRLACRYHRIHILFRVNLKVHKYRSVLYRKRLFYNRIYLIGLCGSQANNTVCLCQLDKIGRCAYVGIQIPFFIEKLLPLPDHAEEFIVQYGYLHRQLILHCGCKLLDIHLDAAVACNVNNNLIRKRKLGANGSREPKAHGAEAA